MAVLYTDLDLFKQVNDEHGHDTGDELLRQVAARLRVSVRDSDLVARLGGDEFVIVLQGLSSPHDPHRIASNIIRHMAEPFYVNGLVLRIGISVGIALFPQHAATTAELLRRADQALYQAKDKGRGAYFFWAHPPLADDHSAVMEAGS
jgi:diguanylate cyclase (GGDEF)-like protein